MTAAAGKFDSEPNAALLQSLSTVEGSSYEDPEGYIYEICKEPRFL